MVRDSGKKKAKTVEGREGWKRHERRAICFLLFLVDRDEEHVDDDVSARVPVGTTYRT